MATSAKNKNETKFDLILIGGGIVGVSTALQLKRKYPDLSILLLEKEASLARHQTGHNSGVVHAGVYYQPGSLKADFCKRGAAATRDFCREHGLPYEQCGKLLVATDALELGRLRDLEVRCGQNGIEVTRLTQAELREREPDIIGLGALLVHETGITDYPRITAKMAELFTDLGGELRFGREVTALSEREDGVLVRLGGETLEGRHLIACGGLMADRLVRMMGIDADFRIVPFRGEYFQLRPRHNNIVRHLIYPVPDPDLPFLGVHLTRMVDGSVTVGPNAVLGWKREGYGAVNISPRDVAEMFSYPGFWKVILANLKSGIMEMIDSLYRPGYLKRVRKYCEKIDYADLGPYPVGIRAQAVKGDGTLVHDFLFAESPRSLHVCNAPSPAATSAMPIGEYLCAKASEKFRL